MKLTTILDMTNYVHVIYGKTLLVMFLLVLVIGMNVGMFLTNLLREPTWHSPKGCPLFVQGEGR